MPAPNAPLLAAAPSRIETARCVLRLYEAEDAPLIKDAIDSSLEHLRGFMAFAWEAPSPVEAIAAQRAEFTAMFEAGTDAVYGIFNPDETELIGGAGLHSRIGPRALEIGYWIRASRVRQGFATEAAGALTRVAFELPEIDRVEIRVDPANVPSLAVPPKLGFVRDGTLRKRLAPVGPSGTVRDAVIFSLFADEFPATPCADVAITTSRA